MSEPTIGRIVHYRLTEADAATINLRRTNSASIVERVKSTPQTWPQGAQAHIGNTASKGDIVPLVIVRVSPDDYGGGISVVINGQALLDGNDVLWVTLVREVREGMGDGCWFWPTRSSE